MKKLFLPVAVLAFYSMSLNAQTTEANSEENEEVSADTNEFRQDPPAEPQAVVTEQQPTMTPMQQPVAAPVDADPVVNTGKGKAHVQLYGFVRNYFYYDSRKCVQSSAGLFNQIQMAKKDNKHGDDLNEQSSARLLAITTRIGLNLNGPVVLGAQTSGKIETDFNGFSSSTTMLRIRHAYAQMDWAKWRVLCGQTWHPMYGEVFPDVLALSSGSPFQPFSRAPQLRVDYKAGKNTTLTADALYQLQYTSVGPNGASAEYSTNAVLPEMYLGLDYKPEHWILGVGLDICRIKPQQTATAKENNESYTKNVDEYVTGFSPIAYMQYTQDLLTIKAKALYGQNTAHLNMMSGYAASSYNDDGTVSDYTTINNFTTWLGLSYGKRKMLSLFFGYSKNLGTGDDVASTSEGIYVRGYDNIDHIYRFCPTFSYNVKAFNLGIEYEATGAAYGDVDSKLKVSNTETVVNHRICAMVKYNF